jgi:hypothetical protein
MALLDTCFCYTLARRRTISGHATGTCPYNAGVTPMPNVMIAATTALALLGTCRTEPAAGPPARIVAGQAGVVVVNGRRPARIAVRVLDASGHLLPDSGVRFRWAAGVPAAVSPAGEVTGAGRGDATVRATLARAAADVRVRCVPVEAVRLDAPVQLVVGDTARAIPVVAYGPDGRPVDLIAAEARIDDSSIATLDRGRIRPRRQGATFLSVTVGDQVANGSVHVYEPTTALDEPRRDARLLAVRVQLAPGEVRRWQLPAGNWMLSMWPEDDDGRGPQLRVERASCMVSQLSRRRWVCQAKDDAAVVVYAPWARHSSATLTGTLAVRPFN